MTDADVTDGTLGYAPEVKIRDLYAARLGDFRPNEKLLRTEYSFAEARVRADMRTLDSDNVLRIWEFKLVADHSGLGQALTYLALARLAERFERPVKGVLAAFAIGANIRTTNEVLNLGLELVVIPPTLRLAGAVLPSTHSQIALPDIALPDIPIRATLQDSPTALGACGDHTLNPPNQDDTYKRHQT
jgi:hypothetical protein